jgi:hypothetical protein
MRVIDLGQEFLRLGLGLRGRSACMRQGLQRPLVAVQAFFIEITFSYFRECTPNFFRPLTLLFGTEYRA